jgi:hypothetical protein
MLPFHNLEMSDSSVFVILGRSSGIATVLEIIAAIAANEKNFRKMIIHLLYYYCWKCYQSLNIIFIKLIVLGIVTRININGFDNDKLILY